MFPPFFIFLYFSLWYTWTDIKYSSFLWSVGVTCWTLLQIDCRNYRNMSSLSNHNFAAVLPGDSVAGLVVANGILNFLNIYNTVLIVRLVLTWFPNAPSVIVSPLRWSSYMLKLWYSKPFNFIIGKGKKILENWIHVNMVLEKFD